MSIFSLRRFRESFFHRFMRKYNLIPIKYFSNKNLLFAKACKMKLFGSKDIISDHIAYLGYYEWELSTIIQKLSKESNLMVDAGANMGYFSLIFLANSNKGKVVSFEPNPTIYKLLITNLENNKFKERGTALEKALSFETGILNFNFGSDAEQSGWGHVNSESDKTVVAVKLDDIFISDDIIDILKIDVEGFEYEVLRGAQNLLSRKLIKNIFFEINDQMLRKSNMTGSLLIKYLSHFGYKIEFITNEIAWAKLND